MTKLLTYYIVWLSLATLTECLRSENLRPSRIPLEKQLPLVSGREERKRREGLREKDVGEGLTFFLAWWKLFNPKIEFFQRQVCFVCFVCFRILLFKFHLGSPSSLVESISSE